MAPQSADRHGSLFSSPRERCLWVATLVVVAAIYATIGLAGTLADVLRDRGLLGMSFALGLVMVVATILAFGLRRRPTGAQVAVALGVAAVYWMVLVRVANPAERTHLVEYGVVALLIHEALAERVSQGRRVPYPALIAVVAAALVGAVDEGLQAVIPNRVFDPRDLLFNLLAAVMAVTASVALRWARRGFQRR